jgi:hypothetical protein
LRAAALHHDDPTDGLSELNSVLAGDPNFESCDVPLSPGQTLLL